MKSLYEDIKKAVKELLHPVVDIDKIDKMSMAEQSKYRTYVVMAVDMRQSGCKVKEIAKWLKVSKREVRRMLTFNSVAEINRRGCKI